MPPILHKLDLTRVGCDEFQIVIELPASESAIERIGALLENEVAWDDYRRGGTRHSVVFGAGRQGDDSVSRYIGRWFTTDPEADVPQRSGDVWAALDSVYEAAVRHEGVHVHGHFELPSGDVQPKMTLPIPLFAPGAFAFNQIQGYRAALVEGERTLWSAVVDQQGTTGAYQVAIQFDEHDLDSATSTRDLFARCVELRDSLMTERENG